MTKCSIEQVEDIKPISEVVYSALVVTIQLCNNIISAKVTMSDLTEIGLKYTNQLRALCTAANSGNVLLCPSFDEVTSAMELCVKKFNYAEECSKRMEVVVKHCSKISEGTKFIYTHIYIYPCVYIYLHNAATCC